MELLQIPNFQSINISERSILNDDALAGASTATFVDVQGFSINDKVILDPGTEISEILTVLSVNATTKVVTFTTNLQNKHFEGATAYKLFGDKIRLYRATNVDGSVPDDADFSLLSTNSITAYNTFTQVTDLTGDSGYWYKSTYFNSVSEAETSLALSYASRGGGYGHYVSIEDVRLEAGLSEATNIDDSIIAARRDQVEAEINGRLAAAGYTIPLQSSDGSAFVPPLVENIARLLTAGYVLMQEYGGGSDGSTKNGNAKIKMANGLLEQIQGHTIVLLDTVGSQLGRTLQVSGWPDDTTATVGTDGVTGEPFMVTMSKRF